VTSASLQGAKANLFPVRVGQKWEVAKGGGGEAESANSHAYLVAFPLPRIRQHGALTLHFLNSKLSILLFSLFEILIRISFGWRTLGPLIVAKITPAGGHPIIAMGSTNYQAPESSLIQSLSPKI